MIGRLSIAMLALAASLAVAARAPAIAEDQVTIRVFDWQSGGPDYWKKTDDLFMQKYPHITVKHEFVPYLTFFNSLGAFVASQDGPDLIQNEPGGNIFDRKDNWVPLNEYFSKDELAQFNGLNALCTDFDCSKEIWGIPHTNQGHLMYLQQGGLQSGRARPGEAAADLQGARRRLRQDQGGGQGVHRARRQGLGFPVDLARTLRADLHARPT